MKTRCQQLLFIAFTSFFCMGITRCPPVNPATLDCTPPQHVTLFRGTSAGFTNPCDNHQWSIDDNFTFNDDMPNVPPQGISIRTMINGPNETRTLFVDPNAPTYTDQPFKFTYEGTSNWGSGIIYLTTGNGVQVTASAAPSTINAGQSTQLIANATSGTPPYTYAWSPRTGLSDPTIPNPIATPQNNSIYTVTVTDILGAIAIASVTIRVNLNMVAGANPSLVDPFQPVQLYALVSGGILPYSYIWTPVAPLNNAMIFDPIATPVVTTTFQVTVADGNGVIASGSVPVRVNLHLTASATPRSINPGQSSQLIAATTGGSLPYSFHWTPSTGLSNPDVYNPVATPSSNTAYTVTVTDATGAHAQVSTTVFVGSQVGPIASLNLFWVSLVSLRADASGSRPGSSPIVRYEYTQAWFGDPNQPPDKCYYAAGLPSGINCVPASDPATYDFAGTSGETVRVRVVDANGLSDAATAVAPPGP